MQERQMLTTMLAELRHKKGTPSIRKIVAELASRNVLLSSSAIHTALTGSAVPHWETLEPILQFLNGDIEEFRIQWELANSEKAEYRVKKALKGNIPMGTLIMKSTLGVEYPVRLTITDSSGKPAHIVVCKLCAGAVFEPDIDEHDIWHEMLRRQILQKATKIS